MLTYDSVFALVGDQKYASAESQASIQEAIGLVFTWVCEFASEQTNCTSALAVGLLIGTT